MGSTRANRLRARMKFILSRRRTRTRRKGFKGLKLIIILLLISALAIAITSIISIIIQNIQENKTEVSKEKEIYIPHEYLKKAYIKASKEEISFSKILTYSAFEAKFVTDGYTNRALRRAVKAAKENEEMTQQQKNLYAIYKQVYDDLKTGPIPEKKEIHIWIEKDQKWKKKDTSLYDYTSVDDFGAPRSYGGDRSHQGNDLIADMGVPIVSMTDGEVTRLGWNEYGGNRVGITSNSGAYFYYAHMDRYEDGLTKGKKVKAGEVIGYIGDTGYGPPGTRGNLIPHLHVQIGFLPRSSTQEYYWFNPYDIIKFLDDYRVTLTEKRN